MSKHAEKKVREDKARRRLVKAQLELHTAQEKRAQAITRADHELERARQRGAKWVAKATERVERRAGAMARAEAHLLTMTSPKHPARPPANRTETTSPAGSTAGEPLTVSSPAAAADVLEQQRLEATAARETSPIVVPEAVEFEAPSASNGNDASEDSNPSPW